MKTWKNLLAPGAVIGILIAWSYYASGLEPATEKLVIFYGACMVLGVVGAALLLWKRTMVAPEPKRNLRKERPQGYTTAQLRAMYPTMFDESGKPLEPGAGREAWGPSPLRGVLGDVRSMQAAMQAAVRAPGKTEMVTEQVLEMMNPLNLLSPINYAAAHHTPEVSSFSPALAPYEAPSFDPGPSVSCDTGSSSDGGSCGGD